MTSLDDAIAQRLRFSELIPVAMSAYRVSDGRVTFTVPNLFEVVLSITGPETSDYWYALDMRFLVAAVAGDELSAEGKNKFLDSQVAIYTRSRLPTRSSSLAEASDYIRCQSTART